MQIPLLLTLLTLTTVAFAGCTMSHGHSIEVDATMPSQAYVGFPIPVAVTGMDEGGHTSSHLGAHFWPAMQDDPTATIGDSTGCAHVSGTVDVAGEHTAMCTFLAAGTYYVYGHIRVVEGDHSDDYWSDPLTIEVMEGYTLTTTETGEGFDMDIAGPAGTSTHVGGHFWADMQDDPTATIGDSTACAHVSGETTLPGSVSVTCDVDGTAYAYGHLRVFLEEVQYDFWAEPIMFEG